MNREMRRLVLVLAAVMVVVAPSRAQTVLQGPVIRKLTISKDDIIQIRMSGSTREPCVNNKPCDFEVWVYAKGSMNAGKPRPNCTIVIPYSPHIEKDQPANKRITWTIVPKTPGDMTAYFFSPVTGVRNGIDLEIDAEAKRRYRPGKDFDDHRGGGTTSFSYLINNKDARDLTTCASGGLCPINFIAVVQRPTSTVPRTCDTEDPVITTTGS